MVSLLAYAAYILIGDWSSFTIPIFILCTHIIIDIIKSYSSPGLKVFVIDQISHFVILIISWQILIYSGKIMIFQNILLNKIKLWIYVNAYLIIILPLSILVDLATTGFREKINSIENKIGLLNAGKWIGIFERIIILSCIFYGIYEVIGFLIAAKSILRFSNSTGNEARMETEYVLFGTLLSFSSTIILGISCKLLINSL